MVLRPLPFVAAALLLLAATAGHAQSSAQMEVTVVEVPVTVHDRGGNAVRGLTAANFEVLVDGKRVPIEHFDTIDLTRVTAAEAQELPAAAHRNFLLLFDLANSTPTVTARAQEAARRFVETQLGERDLAAVATFTVEQGPRMITSFTRDREFLLGAIHTLGDSTYFKVADPLLLSAFLVETKPMEGGEGGSGVSGIDRGSLEHLKDVNARSEITQREEQRDRIRKQLRNFGTVARSLDRLRGQKQIILLSEGFDASLLTGRENLSFRETQAENDAVLSGEIWKVDSDQRFGSASEAKDISEMVELFRRSDVRLHAIDIRGLRSEVDAREGVQKNSNESLFLLTQPTGGTVLRNTNDLTSQFAQLLRQQEVIYILGFRAASGKPGQFHPLRVRLVNAKGEVAHRSGYYDLPPTMNPLEATLRFSELLMTANEVRDVPLSLVATAVPGGDGKARVPVVVDITGTGLLQGLSGTTATANLFVYAFDASNEVRDFMQQRISVDVAQSGDAIRASGVRYVGALNLPPGAYAVKALLRVEETGRIGLVHTGLNVPEYGAAAVLPPVVAADAGQWVTLVSPTRGAVATSLLTLGEQAFIPRKQAEITSRDQPQQIALLLRGVPLENLAITPVLVAADGSSQPAPLKLAGRTSPDEHGVVKLLFRLDPTAIAQGTYDLRFTVASAGGTPSVVSMPVVVR